MTADERDAPSSYAELADVLDNLPLIIREARRARRLSLRACAEQMKVQFSTVARAERGDDIRRSSVIDLLRWLDRGCELREGDRTGGDG